MNLVKQFCLVDLQIPLPGRVYLIYTPERHKGVFAKKVPFSGLS